jgi:hypothetical protein
LMPSPGRHCGLPGNAPKGVFSAKPHLPCIGAQLEMRRNKTIYT